MDFYLAISLKWPDIMLPPSLQANVLQIGAIRDYYIKHVSQHFAVGFAVLGLGGSVSPGDVEHVGDIGER